MIFLDGTGEIKKEQRNRFLFYSSKMTKFKVPGWMLDEDFCVNPESKTIENQLYVLLPSKNFIPKKVRLLVEELKVFCLEEF